MYTRTGGGALLGAVGGGAAGGALGGSSVLGGQQAQSLAFTGVAVATAAFIGVLLVVVGLLLLRLSLQRRAQ